MAQESCNLDKEEAEILKPSSSSPSPSPSPSSTPSPTPLPPISSTSPPPPPPSLISSSAPPLFLNSPKEFSLKRPDRPETPTEEPRPSARLGNRCSTCRKRVGLTGFRCRCGDLFCGRHRYSDIHDCSFDYKAMGREEISKANPVVRAAKIIKI